jgi:hypothetical protein
VFGQQVGDIAGVAGHIRPPRAEATVRVDGVGPAVCGLGLYVAQGIVAFGFEDKVAFGVAMQANDEVGDVVVGLVSDASEVGCAWWYPGLPAEH